MFYFRLNLKQKFPMERNSQFSDLADSGIRLVFALLAGWTQFFSQSKCPEAAGDFILGKFYSGLKPIFFRGIDIALTLKSHFLFVLQERYGGNVRGTRA